MNYCGNCIYWRMSQRPDSGIMTGDFRCQSPNGIVRNTMVAFYMQACPSFKDKADFANIANYVHILKQLV